MTGRFNDVRAAIVELPTARVWKQCLLVYAAFCVCALPIGFATGFFRLGIAELSPSMLALLPVYIMLRPALLEELVFRALLLPRDPTRVRKRNLILIASVSLAVFVASHPVNARLFRPAAFDLFTSPIFLVMATLLGIACTAMYLISKSLWPPVLFHWSAVLIWITLFGGQGLVGNRELNSGRLRSEEPRRNHEKTTSIVGCVRADSRHSFGRRCHGNLAGYIDASRRDRRLGG